MIIAHKCPLIALNGLKYTQKSSSKPISIFCAVVTLVCTHGQILPFSCISPQLTLKTIETDTEGRKQASLVFHPLSLVLLLHKCGQCVEGFRLLQNKLTLPLPNIHLCSLLYVPTFLAIEKVSTASHKEPTHWKAVMFGSGSATACTLSEGKDNLLHSNHQNASRKTLMVSFKITNQR